MRKIGKVVLFQPENFSATRHYYGVPMQLLAISRILAKEGYEIKIITPVDFENPKEEVLKQAKGAICVGLTVLTGYSIHDSLKVSKMIKKHYPKLPVVWGGWHPSILPIETLVDENIDIVIKGQGERTFAEVVHSLETKKSLKNILGIAYKNKAKEIIENPDRPLESLDNFPPIPYWLLNIEKYILPMEFGERSLTYYTSCGCPHNCIFCVEPIVNKCHWVGLSPQKAADEITKLKNEYNLDSIQIIDSNFFISEDRAIQFSQRLIDNKTNIKWGDVNGRTKQMSNYKESTWKLMKKSGLECVLVGAESGDNKILKFMNKGITVEDTLNFTKICAKFDIKILSSFLVGFPRSNNTQKCFKLVDEEIDSAFKLIDKMFKIYPRIRMMFALYLPYPSSGLFEQSKKIGLDLPDNLEDWSDYLIASEDVFNQKVRQKWVTKIQARKILMASVYIFFFLDPDSFGMVTGKVKNKLFKFFLKFGFNIGKAIACFRWRHRYFSLPIDFYIYNYLRQHLNLFKN